MTDPNRYCGFEPVVLRKAQFYLTLTRPLRRKLRMRWFYSLFERMRLKGKTMFIHTNQSSTPSFYIKKSTYFCRMSDDPQFSAHWACEGVNRSGVWGLNLTFIKIDNCIWKYSLWLEFKVLLRTVRRICKVRSVNLGGWIWGRIVQKRLRWLGGGSRAQSLMQK